MAKQLELFEGEDLRPQPKRPKVTCNQSNNPIVFHDYDSFVAKFNDVAKTTDDCYTPKDIFDEVVKYVGTIVNLSDKLILRPFFPGGDYENAEYPDNGVVIDNPPFSLFTNIVRFYSARQIPFFLFGPGMTIASCCKYCTAVIINTTVRWDNGAQVRLNFASNLFGDLYMTTAPELNKAIKACPSQNQTRGLPTYAYPEELLSVSDMQTICGGGVKFSISRHEAVIVKKLDNKPMDSGLFGDHFLLSADKAAAKAAAKNVIHIPLSDRERRIVEKLKDKNNNNTEL